MENTNEQDFRIDLDSVIRNKNPKLLKLLPRFVLNFIKRIIHQDELNAIISKLNGLYNLDYVNEGLKDLGAMYVVKGYENIPQHGRFIFAGNHPLGGLDGLVLISAVGKKFSNVKFIVNDLLLNIKSMDDIFVPVNKHGRQTTDYARKIEDAYSSNAQILYFPAGLCSRKIKGTIIDLEWHRNFILKAIEYKRDVVPFYFEARNSNFFYNLANLRKWLGIKVNIEMFFLVNELFKQRTKKIELTFGKPIPYTMFGKGGDKKEWANYVRNCVYDIPQK
jgi:putative hemolysin